MFNYYFDMPGIGFKEILFFSYSFVFVLQMHYCVVMRHIAYTRTHAQQTVRVVLSADILSFVCFVYLFILPFSHHYNIIMCIWKYKKTLLVFHSISFICSAVGFSHVGTVINVVITIASFHFISFLFRLFFLFFCLFVYFEIQNRFLLEYYYQSHIIIIRFYTK